MVKIDMMEVSQGCKGLVTQCLDLTKSQAYQEMNASMNLGKAIYRAEKIAGKALDVFKQSFVEQFPDLDEGYTLNYVGVAENALFLRSHIDLLIDILLGKVDPEPKESISPSHLPDKV